MKRFVIILILIITASLNAFSITKINNLALKQRLDHDGGRSGYHLGDTALLGFQLYSSPAGFCENESIGDIGTMLMVDTAWNKFVYNYIKTEVKDLFFISISYEIPSATSFYYNFLNPWDIVGTDYGVNFVSDKGKHRIVKIQNNNRILVPFVHQYTRAHPYLCIHPIFAPLYM